MTPPRQPHIDTQHRRSMLLLTTSIARVIAWTLLSACVGAGLLHIDGFHWALTLAKSLPFVVLISCYANLATDADAATASYAAVVASDAHHDAEYAHHALTGDTPAPDLVDIADQVLVLAAMRPGPNADALAARLHDQLQPR